VVNESIVRFLVIPLTVHCALHAQSPLPHENVPTPLKPGETIEREIAGAQTHEFQLKLEAGQYLMLKLLQPTINVSVACLGPDNEKRFEVDSHWIGETEMPELIADTSGPYRFLVTAPDRHAPPGRYDIAIQTVEAATETHRSRIAAARAYAEGKAAYQPLVRAALLKSIAAFEEALKHWRAARDLPEESRTLSDMGMMYVQLGEPRKATECANQALALARTAGDRQMEASAITTLGVIDNNFGDKKAAIEYFDRALLLTRETHDRSGEGNTLNYLGRAYFRSGENHKALPYLESALEVARDIHDRGMEAYILGDIGSAHSILGDYRQSLESHQQEVAVEREIENHGAEAVALNNIGFAYMGLGEYQKALDFYTASADLNRRLDPKGDRLAISLHNIGWIYYKLGERERALQFNEQAVPLLRAVQNRSSLASALSAMGVIYGEMNESQRAIELHSEALALRRASHDMDGEAASLTNLGSEYAKLRDWPKAREYHERAVAILRTSGNQSQLVSALGSLGDLYRETGDRQQARACLEEALEISRTIRDRPGEAKALAVLARVEHDGGDLVKAQARADEALNAFESVRRTIISPNLRASFFASVRDIQELDVELLMALHAERPQEGFGTAALLAAERGRARSLLELLQESGAGIRSDVDASLIAREQDLERLISAKADAQVRLLSRKHTGPEADEMTKELAGMVADLDQVQSRIRSASPRYAALTQPSLLDLKEIQSKVLDADTVLLEYALGKEKSFLWVVGPSSTDTFDLPPRAEIESTARRVYDLLTARNQKPAKETPAERAARLRRADRDYLDAAVKASRILLVPAASRIDNKRLLIAGEGVLQYLPFAALPEPRADRTVSANSPPLIVNHEINTAASASVVAVLRQETAGRSPTRKTLAVFADPVFGADDARVEASRRDSVSAQARRHDAGPDPQEFLRLRFSRAEADEISRLAPAGTTLKILDFEASRDAVLRADLAQYRILHFATHSLINSEHPELSGVVLSLVDRAGQRQNGFLRLYDIYKLHLGADLVVLSACRTALGREVRSEGLIGLTRGFLYAGAQRVAASLWEIDDRTTAELMKRFYEGMLVRGERPAAALRTAQVAMWKTKGWNAPYYWAAFTLQGEWR
jgi:CHAT domain-containing protein/tetratricopeptide (TPR) repeat protein